MREAQRKIRKSKSCGFLYLPRGRFEQLVSSEQACADDPLVHVHPQVRASHRAAGPQRRVSSLTLLTGMNCVPRRLRLCFSHRSQRRVVRVRKSLHLMFTERCWIMLRCKPGEAWGDRGRSSPRLAERCDGAVDQCRDVGENVVPRRVLTPAGHRADDRREVTRRIRADRLGACVCRLASVESHRPTPVPSGSEATPNASARACARPIPQRSCGPICRCWYDAAATRWSSGPRFRTSVWLRHYV